MSGTGSHHRPRVQCALAGALLLWLCPHAWAGEGEDRLNAFLEGFQTLEARFEQTLLDEKGRTLEVSRGVVALSRPGRFRWDYEAPYAQTIVADGQAVWIYDQDLEQVTRKPLDAAIGSTPALILDSKAAVVEHYAVYELGEDQDLVWVALRPREESNQYSDIRLGFDEPGLRVMELRDNFGQTTRVRFAEERFDPALEASRFEFTPPPGVDVIDAAETM